MFWWNLLQLSSCLKCAMSEIGPVVYSRLQKGSHSDPWEMIIHSQRRWPLRPREVVTQTLGGSHSVQWKGQGSGARSWNSELQYGPLQGDNVVLPHPTHFCPEYGCSISPRNACNRLEDYLVPKPRHLQSE